MKKTRAFGWFVVFAGVLLGPVGRPRPALAAEGDARAARYVAAVRGFADTVVQRGRDVYGRQKTPLFVDGLHAKTLQPARWPRGGETWVLCNFASQQPLLRTLDGLTALTGEGKYRRAAEEATRHALTNLRGPSGLLYWGGHLAWDLERDKAVGQYKDAHELKTHQPYYRLMWRVDRDATAKLMAAVWAGHILDWSLLDYNRHASVSKAASPRWDHPFRENIDVPFPAKGGNLSFVNVTPPLLHSGAMLAVLGKHDRALTWTRRLISRWQQGKDAKTGLCGGQLSYRKHDRARLALGHVHPTINEAKVVASYHQISRYHHLPLAQMQAGEALLAAGPRRARVGRELIRWAAEDLKIYARHCYDPKTGHFVARMTDGTAIRWRESRTGYYVPASFAPRQPDGMLLWACATAYRLTRDQAHWHMARQIAKSLGLGELDRPDTDSRNWQAIYALLELHRAKPDAGYLRLACRIADNILETQTKTALFPRPGRQYARTGDEAPLAVLHLAAAVAGKRALMPPPMLDSRFFHCEYHGKLAQHQQKRADRRTDDNLVFYGGP